MKPVAFVTIPYTDVERAEIRACFGIKDRHDPKIKGSERLLTLKHAAAIKQLMDGRVEKPDLVGFHGQTIYHAPKDGTTIQIGDGDLLARETGIDVIDDFRSNDVKAGGEGAPLAPAYHAARVRSDKIELPCVVLNIGGVANVTWIGVGEDDILAFDTGPGHAVMDDWVKTRNGAAYDKDGVLAASGKPVRALLDAWFVHAYFKRLPPKSLDRDQWDIAALGQVTQGMDAISDADGAATLLEFTAETIARSVEHMPVAPRAWYACGGGRHNKALMAALKTRLNGAVKSVDDLGWDGDATEAECFAYLAVRSALGLPLSFPTTTGISKPLGGGVRHKAR